MLQLAHLMNKIHSWTYCSASLTWTRKYSQAHWQMKRNQGAWINPSAFVFMHKILHLELQKLLRILREQKKLLSFFSSEREVKHAEKSDLYSIICLSLSKYFTKDRFITYIQDHFSLMIVIAFHSQTSFPLTHLFVLMWLLEITHNHSSLLPFCIPLLQQTRW